MVKLGVDDARPSDNDGIHGDSMLLDASLSLQSCGVLD